MKTLMEISRSFTASMLLQALVLMPHPPATDAQIYEWVDEQGGVRHYTTSLQDIPEAARSKARLFIEEAPMSRLEDEVPMTKVEGARELPDETESSDVEKAPLAEAFRAGVESGFLAARQEQPLAPVEPPVVILQTPPPVVVTIPWYDPSGLSYRSPYEGTMTVPFDDGRSRGLTHRQHLQEQRRIERGR